MINFIIKDIKFNKRLFIFASILLLIAPLVLSNVEKTNSQFYAVIFYSPLLYTNYMIGKFCYLEDSDYTVNFLKALPISKYVRLGSRYIEVFILVLLCVGYCSLIEYIFFVEIIAISVQYFLITCSALFIYFALYLGLFYLKNYQYAQQSINIAFIVFLGVVALCNFFEINIMFELNTTLLIIVFILSSLVLYVSYSIVCKHD